MLVLGGSGLLGSNLVHAARSRRLPVAATYHSTRPDLDVPLRKEDLEERESLEDLLDDYPEGPVVNCAAVTDVDGCEEAPENAEAVNATAPGAIARACSERGRPFVHVSTDYVFDGTLRTPYDERAVPRPIQTYGRSKLRGERAVRESAPDALIVRLSFVYGIHRSSDDLTGFPAWVRERLETGERVPLFTDQFVTPSRAGQSAETVLDLLDAGASGTVHVASRSCVTPYQFGELLASRLGAPTDLLEEGSTAELDREAERPVYTCLDVSRVERILGRPQPTLEADVEAVLDEAAS